LRSWPIVKYKEGENPWITYFKKQVYQKNSCINAMANGMPGTGKSYSLIYMLSQCDPTFNIDRIFFRASKMLRYINSNEFGKGKGFMFDEAGVDASNTNWWDEINKGLSAFFQTGRSDNYFFGISVPFASMISKGVRTLMNVKFECEGWTNNNLTKVKPYILEYNGEIDKFYKKRLFVRTPNASSYCNTIKLPLADKHLLHEYEKKKKEFKNELYNQIAGNIEKYENATFSLTHTQKEYYELAEQGYTMEEICSTLDITERNAYYLVKAIRKKGYDIPEDKERKKQILEKLKAIDEMKLKSEQKTLTLNKNEGIESK